MLAYDATLEILPQKKTLAQLYIRIGYLVLLRTMVMNLKDHPVGGLFEFFIIYIYIYIYNFILFLFLFSFHVNLLFLIFKYFIWIRVSTRIALRTAGYYVSFLMPAQHRFLTSSNIGLVYTRTHGAWLKGIWIKE